MARKTAYCGMSYLAGLMAASFLVWSTASGIAAGLICAAVTVLILMRPQKSSRTFGHAVCIISFSAGILLYCGYDMAVRIPAEQCAGQIFTGQAQITEAKHYSGVSVYTLKLTLPNGRRGKASYTAYDDHDLVRGDKLYLSARLTLPDSGGFFDERNYLRSQGVFLKAEDTVIGSIELSRNSFFAAVDSARRRTAAQIRDIAGGIVTKDSAELVIGMLFGNDFWNMSSFGEDSLDSAGIGHIGAVSGMHMVISAGIAAAFMELLKAPRWAGFVVTVLFAGIFGFFADMSMSVMRSFVMITLVSAAELFNRRSDTLTSLSIAAVMLTCTSPFCVRDASFILSAAGVFGAGVMAPVLIRYFEERINRNRSEDEKYKAGWLVTGAAVSFSAAAAVFPVQVMFFDSISLIAPLSNLLLAPLYVSGAGLAAVGGILSVTGITSLSTVMFGASGIVCTAVLYFAGLTADIPSVCIPAHTEIMPALIIAVLAACIVCGIFVRNKACTVLTLYMGIMMSCAAVMIYTMDRSDITRLTVLTEGKGCVMVVDSGEGSLVIDLMGSSAGVKAARSYLRRTGCSPVSEIVIIDGNGKTEALYSEKFPEVPIIVTEREIGLTYGDKENIIVNGCEIMPRDGYCIIGTEGILAAAVNRSAELPENEYDLAVINCRAKTDVKGKLYAVTRTSYTGELPEEAVCTYGQTEEYIIYNGAIAVKEASHWLS